MSVAPQTQADPSPRPSPGRASDSSVTGTRTEESEEVDRRPPRNRQAGHAGRPSRPPPRPPLTPPPLLGAREPPGGAGCARESSHKTLASVDCPWPQENSSDLRGRRRNGVWRPGLGSQLENLLGLLAEADTREGQAPRRPPCPGPVRVGPARAPRAPKGCPTCSQLRRAERKQEEAGFFSGGASRTEGCRRATRGCELTAPPLPWGQQQPWAPQRSRGPRRRPEAAGGHGSRSL